MANEFPENRASLIPSRVPTYWTKKDVIKAAEAQAAQYQERIDNQKASIERLMNRWNLLKTFVQAANNELESATCIALSQGILDEMGRLENADD